MKIRFTKMFRVYIAAVLAISAIGFISCGTKSYLSQITISPDSPSMLIGTTYQLTGYGVLSNGVTFLESYLTWTSSNDSIASVDSSGIVSSPSATAGGVTGSVTITATETDSHTNVSGFTVVSICTLSSVAVSPANAVMAISTATTSTTTYQFTAIATLLTSTTVTQIVTSYMTWTSSNDTIASVDPATGIVTAGSVTGPVTITATQGDGIRVSGDPVITGETMLTLIGSALSSLVISEANSSTSVAVGSTLTLSATGTYADGTTGTTGDMTSHLTWSSSDTTIATVGTAGTVDSSGLDNSGVVTGVASGTVTITATDPITAVYASYAISIN